MNAKLTAIKTAIKKASPEILLGFGLISMAGSVIFAVKDTPKVEKMLDEQKPETIKEKAIIYAKGYVPSALTFAAGATCILSSHHIVAGRVAAATVACRAIDTAYHEFRDKAVEVLGEDSVREVDSKIKEDRQSTNASTMVFGSGDVLCYDKKFDRVFMSNANAIDRAVNEAYRLMLDDDYASVNDIWCGIGLDPIPIGYEMGWNSRDTRSIEVYYTADIFEGKPCLVVNYTTPPRYNFYVEG